MKNLVWLLILGVLFGALVIIAKKGKVPTQSSLVPSSNTIVSTSPGSTTTSATPTTSTSQNKPVVKEINLTVDQPKDGATVNNPSLQVKGATIAGATVFINEKETTAGNNGNFSATITLDEGENTVVVIAQDENGQVAEVDLTVTLQIGL